MANILILGVKVPFTGGGQEVLVNTLRKELTKRGHNVDTVELPFTVFPKESLLHQAAQWRSLDLSSFSGLDVDLIIATKFPSYYAKHPKKSLWLVHQKREIYDLFGSRFSDFSDDPRDEALRQMLVQGDEKVIGECRYVSGISQNVITRLNNYLDIPGEVLYPPLPLGDSYKPGPFGDYILSVGRICTIKRVDLMIKGMPIVHKHIKLKVVGTPDEPGIMEYFTNEIKKHHLEQQVEFLGRVSDEELLDLYSGALGVYYAPHDEDYGYVTLEAFASGKPIITAHDSGGVLEFAEHDKNSLIVEPESHALGHAVNTLAGDPDKANQLGAAGRSFIESSGLHKTGWDKVVNGLLSPLEENRKGNEVVGL